MRKKFSARAAALGMSGVLLTSALTGCTFGFASDPDDPNAVKEEVPIDMTTDTFQYDTSLSGTSIVIMNTKAEIQTALEKIAKVFEEKAVGSGKLFCDLHGYADAGDGGHRGDEKNSKQCA